MDITVFIRSKNEAALLPRCLDAIFTQRHSYSLEVVLLDSGSTDGTIEIAKAYPVRILQIPSKIFSYSGTLNAGIDLSAGAFFVPLSAHAVPCNENWLGELIKPLIDNPGLLATYSRQVTWPDACVPEQRQMSRTFPTKPRMISPDHWNLSLSEGHEPFSMVKFSNASAAYRRSYLIEHPFRSLLFCEDRCAAIEILRHGGCVQYIPTSIVFHSHTPDFRAFRKIARDATIARFEINGMVTEADGRWRDLPSRKKIFAASSKIPLYVLWLSISLWFVILRGRRETRMREFAWKIASLGTTFGKQEGLCAVFRKRLWYTPEIADTKDIVSWLEGEEHNRK